MLLRLIKLKGAFMDDNLNNIKPDAFLNLFSDPFFAYSKKNKTITIYNSVKTRIDPGVYSVSEFVNKLKTSLKGEDLVSIDTFADHLAQGHDYFSHSFSDNIVNDDPATEGTLIRGMQSESDEDLIVGVIHPKRSRTFSITNDAQLDSLTGLMDKICITKYAIDLIDNQKVENTFVAIVDIDYFKHVNDSYGHQYGDYVLRQCADIIRSEVGEHGVVGRIGGDEFFVIFTPNLTESALRDCLRNIRVVMSRSFEGKGPYGNTPITLSIGAASYPEDAPNYNDLFVVADYCLYLAKAKGRNRYIIYNHSKHATLDIIKSIRTTGKSMVNGRDDLPHGDVLTQIVYMLRYNHKASLPNLLSDFAFRFNIPYLAILGKSDGLPFVKAGPTAEKLIVDTKMLTPLLYGFCDLCDPDYGIYVCNHVTHFPPDFDPYLRPMLDKMDLISFIAVPLRHVSGEEYMFFLGSFGVNLVWNSDHFMHIRLLCDELEKNSLLAPENDE